MDNVLCIITGTSKGIGHKLKNILKDTDLDLICLNRTLQDEYDYKFDLSHIENVMVILHDFRKKIEDNYPNHKIIFVNNASIIEPIGKIGTFKKYQIVECINTNIGSPLLLLNLLASLDNEFAIINIISGAAHTTNKHLGIYSSSKLFMETYLKFINIEDNNCFKVINYNPGVVKTEMHNSLKNNIFFKNEVFDSIIPREPRDVATEIQSIIREIDDD
jgi:short-subunit dehydrogenase